MTVSSGKRTSGPRIEAGYEPISGYVLEELVGRGGYGEVWRAKAPGGINKAVKFVFGNRDEKHATQELKSLERIKGIQHPFILSLERFDIIDDRLVIITEFADGSLQDVYERYQKNGSCGIPRNTLIKQLSDTADALDHLHRLYNLQHLDVKPANLLMVGGRIKVADFGLIKDLREIDQSVIGGLTPIYAPPELFDGRPSEHSDQYSLAVLYQEMLTGKRPFSGRTIAQLASQHVYNAPNLTPLPPADRPVVARALEKSPARRFGSCTEFVAALSSPATSTRSVAIPVDTPAKVKNLPQLDPTLNQPATLGAKRVIVLGLGGVGAEVVSLLRAKIGEQKSESPVILDSLVIDTNCDTAYDFDEDLESDFLRSHRTITTPLRSAVDYRRNGTDHVKSISRRWIYNVPKGLSTEGMRPLGRLAMLDHAKKVTDAIRKLVQQLQGEVGVPSIYVVGSLAGGSGSGMYVDMACLLRNLLDDAGFHEVEIISLLSTVRFQGDPRRPLGLHNTTAAIQEIEHYLKLENGYPGDEGAGWRPVPASRTPLSNIYLIAESTAVGAQTTSETIIDYLWTDAAVASKCLHEARQVDSESSTANPMYLRSVGISYLGNSESDIASMLAPFAIRELLRRWLGNPANAKDRAARTVDRIRRKNRLQASEFCDSVLHSIGDADVRDATITARLRAAPQQMFANKSMLVTFVNRIVSSMIPEGDLDGLDVRSMVKLLKQETSLNLLNRSLDMASAIRTTQLVSQEAKQVAEELTETTHVNARQEFDFSESTPNRIGRQDPQLMRDAFLLARERLYVEACIIAAKKASEFSQQASKFAEHLSKCALLLAKVLRDLPADREKTLERKLGMELSPMLREFHRLSARSWLQPLVVEDQRECTAKQLHEGLVEISARQVLQSVRKANESKADLSTDKNPLGLTTNITRYRPDSMANSTAMTCTQDFASDTTSTEEDLTNSDLVIAARPVLLDCGGSQRLILIAGTERELEMLERDVKAEFDGDITGIVVPSCAPTLIHDAQQIEIKDVIKRLQILSGGDLKISKRLLSRSDVEFRLDANSPFDQSES